MLVDGKRWVRGSSGERRVRRGRPQHDSHRRDRAHRSAAGRRFADLRLRRDRRRRQRHHASRTSRASSSRRTRACTTRATATRRITACRGARAATRPARFLSVGYARQDRRVLGRPRAVALRALRRVGLQLQRQLRHAAGPLHLPRSARRRSGCGHRSGRHRHRAGHRRDAAPTTTRTTRAAPTSTTSANADRFNFRPFNYLATPNRRVNVFGKADYDVSDRCRADVHGVVHEPRVEQPGCAESVVHGQRTPAPASSSTTCSSRPITRSTRSASISARWHRREQSDPDRPAPARSRSAHLRSERRHLDPVGRARRRPAARRAHALFWDVSLNWGRNNASQTGPQHLQRAQAGAGARCPWTRALAVPGCVPFNIFGGRADGTAASRRRCSPGRRSRRTTERAGAQRRRAQPDRRAVRHARRARSRMRSATSTARRRGSFMPDSIAQSGETADVPASPTAGRDEGRKKPISSCARRCWRTCRPSQRLELSAAVRSSDYDNFGRDEVFKGGLYWRVVRRTCRCARTTPKASARRTSASCSTPARASTATLDDPCDADALAANPALAANCQALGVPARSSSSTRRSACRPAAIPISRRRRPIPTRSGSATARRGRRTPPGSRSSRST